LIFHYSLSVSSGYIKAANEPLDQSGTVTLAEGYVSALLHRRRFSLLAQHDAQFTRAPGIGIGFGQYERSALSFAGRKSRLTTWTFLFENGYGSDGARAAGDLGNAALNGEAVPNLNVVAFGLTTGNILSDHALFSMDHKLSPSRVLNFSAGGYFHHFFDGGTSDQQYSLTTGMQQRVSTRQTVGINVRAVQENYTQTHCTTGFVGLSSFTQLTRTLRFEGMAGPAWGTAYCSGTYEYTASLAMRAGQHGLLYVGSTRQRNDGLVLNSTWETSTFGGLALGQPRRIQALATGGYSNYALAKHTAAYPNLHGYFVSGELHRRLTSAAEVSMTARYFSNSQGQATGNMFLFTSTYTWSPEDRHTHRWSQGIVHGNR